MCFRHKSLQIYRFDRSQRILISPRYVDWDNRSRWYFFLPRLYQSMHIIVHVRHQSPIKLPEKHTLLKFISSFRSIGRRSAPWSHPQRQITARCKCHVNLLVNIAPLSHPFIHPSIHRMVLNVMSLLSLETPHCLQQITLMHQQWSSRHTSQFTTESVRASN